MWKPRIFRAYSPLYGRIAWRVADDSLTVPPGCMHFYMAAWHFCITLNTKERNQPLPAKIS